jgi:ketosteroid isomerase-like protein
MKKAIYFGIVLIFFMSCQQKKQTNTTSEEYQAEVKQQIAQLDKLYFEAWENKDLDSTLSFLDKGFINMFSFGLSQTKEECREAWSGVFDAYSIDNVEFKSIELIADLNYAFETGLFKQRWITNDKQDTLLFDMRGITVFKKQGDGGWKMFRLIGQQK